MNIGRKRIELIELIQIEFIITYIFYYLYIFSLLLFANNKLLCASVAKYNSYSSMAS